MSKNYERDEREEYWRRPQQNREPQERWSGSGREDDYSWGAQGQEGRDWRRNEEYERRRWQEMKSRERGEGERGGWEGGRGRQWGNEDYDYGRERHYGTQSRNWPGGRGESQARGWEGGQQNWGMGRQGWQGGGEWQGRDWEGEYGNDQPYGRDFGRDWDERTGGMSRGQFGGRGGMMGTRNREGQWEGGWNRGRDRGMEGQWEGGWNRGRDRGMEGQYAGRGPRAYKRSDHRIEEDINERLTQHSMIDASDIEVTVQNGEVTLRGHVDHREAKRLAEDIAENIFGVKDVNNQIKVKQRGEGEEGRHEGDTSGKRERKAS
jgi:hypothetical protein